MNKNKVLVIGDGIVDIFIEHTSTRQSPEANCPVIVEKEARWFEGGAVNVYKNLLSLGAEAKFFTWCHPHSKTRVLLNGQQLCRKDEAKKPIPTPSPDLIKELGDSILWCDVVVLSDYGLGQLDDPQPFIRLAKEAGKLVIVDPYKGKPDWTVYQGADLIKCNADEWNSATNKVDFKEVIVTAGPAGSVYTSQAETYRVPGYDVEPVDVTGCGDSFLAVVAMLYGHTNMVDLLQHANRAGAVAVGKPYTAVVTAAEVFGA